LGYRRSRNGFRIGNGKCLGAAGRDQALVARWRDTTSCPPPSAVITAEPMYPGTRTPDCDAREGEWARTLVRLGVRCGGW
jgi:hypothetical protein